MLYWQKCPKCGHISTPDCWKCVCHHCGQAKYHQYIEYVDGKEIDWSKADDK